MSSYVQPGYYISFLKSLALRLNQETVKQLGSANRGSEGHGLGNTYIFFGRWLQDDESSIFRILSAVSVFGMTIILFIGE